MCKSKQVPPNQLLKNITLTWLIITTTIICTPLADSSHSIQMFGDEFCLDFKSDPNPKLVAVTKSAIAAVPGLCYVVSLNTNLPRTFDVVKKLGLFPHTDSTKNFLMHGKLTDYGSHLHMERNHTPVSGVGYVGWKFSLYSFIRGTIIGTVCYFTGALVGSQPEFRAAYDAQVNWYTPFRLSTIPNLSSELYPN